MKKIAAIMSALIMVFALAAAAPAEQANVPSFTGGVQFNMDMDQVMQLVRLPNPEIDKENRGTTEFYELEYEDVTGADGFTADVKYTFVGNSLIAISFDMAEHTSYDAVKAALTKTYGEAVPFDAAKIGNARYVIDDKGDLKDCREMICAEGLTIVLERDNDGDVEVIFLDPTAAYINN